MIDVNMFYTKLRLLFTHAIRQVSNHIVRILCGSQHLLHIGNEVVVTIDVGFSQIRHSLWRDHCWIVRPLNLNKSMYSQ